MKKIQIFTSIFITLSFFSSTYAEDEVHIISRKEWGANETLRYISSPEWQAIIKKREENALLPLTDTQKEAMSETRKKSKQIAEYFNKNFAQESKVIEKISYDH